MNSRKRLIYSLLTILFAAGCNVVGERKVVHISKQWPAAGVKHIEVNEIDGTINVEASETNEITMNAVVRTRIPSKPNEENQGFFRTELEGDTLTIGRKSDHHWGVHFGIGDEYSVTYELRVPSSVSLELRTVNGK